MSDRPVPLRIEYRRELDEIHREVIVLFGLVSEAVTAASEALLGDDRAAADHVAQGEEVIDQSSAALEERLERVLLLQAPVAGDLRYLLSLIRIVPELERSGDLAEHVAGRAGTGLTAELPPAVRGILAQMGAAATVLWRGAADAFADRDETAHERLDAADDEIDDLHRLLVEEIERGDLRPEVAAETALLGRFYERLGDHAVHVAGRIHHAVTGD